MRIPVLTNDKAKEMVDILDPPCEIDPNVASYQSTNGAGEPLDLSSVEDLAHELGQLWRDCAEDTKLFDSRACVLVHRSVPREPEALSDDGFWRWLALGPLRQITIYRYPPSKDREDEAGMVIPGRYNRQNFGVGASARQRAECYPYKLWLRAELGHFTGGDDGKDPYRFAMRGDVDFWTSHVHRQSYTTNRLLCSSLVRTQFPDDRDGSPLLVSGEESVSDGIRGIRTLAKRLRRLQATYELNVLDQDELDVLVSEQASDLTRAAKQK